MYGMQVSLLTAQTSECRYQLLHDQRTRNEKPRLSYMCNSMQQDTTIDTKGVAATLHAKLESNAIERHLFPQAYARKMNRCLLETSHNGNSPAIMQELREWSSQVNSLIVFLAVGNVRNFVAFTGTRLDGNQGPSVAELPDSWYHSFTVSHLSSFSHSVRGCLFCCVHKVVVMRVIQVIWHAVRLLQLCKLTSAADMY